MPSLCFGVSHALSAFGSRIYDLHYMSEIRTIEAHESDVVCLEYSFSKAGEHGVLFSLCIFREKGNKQTKVTTKNRLSIEVCQWTVFLLLSFLSSGFQIIAVGFVLLDITALEQFTLCLNLTSSLSVCAGM